MKLKFCSDFHMEFFNYNKIDRLLEMKFPTDPDDINTVLVCAGDIGTYTHYASSYKPFFKIMSKRFKHVIVVPGNHSWYNSSLWGREKEIWKDKKLPSNVHYLDNDTFILDDVVFIGSCMWCDFNDSDPLAMYHVSRSMSDFKIIKKGIHEVCGAYGQIISSNKLSPEDVVQRYHESNAYIHMMLDIHREKKCVVVTHHAPSSLSTPNEFKGNLLSYAYHSRLEEFILDRPQIKIWSHGHTHTSFNYNIGETNIICNPFGYFHQSENKNFDPNLTVEI